MEGEGDKQGGARPGAGAHGFAMHHARERKRCGGGGGAVAPQRAPRAFATVSGGSAARAVSVCCSMVRNSASVSTSARS